MAMLLLVTAILLGASGALWWRLCAARRTIRELRRGLQAGESFGAEKMAILHDANATLRERGQELQRRHDDLQREFAALCYSVAHDLRAPLRSVSGFSQALSEDHGHRLEPAARDYLRRLQAGAQNLHAMIDEVLALSRIVQAPFHAQRVDLSALAWEIARELSASEMNRRVEWVIQPGIGVVGDPGLLVSALRHLLGNAWKFTASRLNARIIFRAVQAPEGTLYEVSDNGVGFDPDYAGKLFGLFQRMHPAGEFPGNGTGLATVQRIVRRHGGRIHATAEPDVGATFSFSLNAQPRVETDGEQPFFPKTLPASSAGKLGSSPQRSTAV